MGKGTCTFKVSWRKEWPFIVKATFRGDTERGAHCKICNKSFSVAKNGRYQVVRHIKSGLHKRNEVEKPPESFQFVEGEEEEEVSVKKEVEVENNDGFDFDYFGRESEAYQISCPPSSCFVCDVNFEAVNPPDITESERMFLIKNVLKLVKASGEDLQLNKVFLCSLCLNSVRNALQIKQKILKLERKLKEVEGQILAKALGKKAGLIKGIINETGQEEGSPSDNAELDPDWVNSNSSAYEENMDEAERPISSCRRTPGQVYYCGLCDDDAIYETEAVLKEHTREAHFNSLLNEVKPERPRHDKEGVKAQLIGVDEEEKEKFKYDCPSCPEVKDYTLNAFARHLTIHQKRPYICKLCSDFLHPDQNSWNVHWEQKHSNISHEDYLTEAICWRQLDPGLIYKCHGCLEGFKSEVERNEHELSCVMEKKPIKCSPRDCKVCNKSLKNFDEWRLHRVLEHPEIDRMSCFYCDVSFAELTLNGLEERHDGKFHEHLKNSHYSKYLGRRFYEFCESCNLEIGGPLKMKEHFQTKHGVQDDKVYFCRFCNHSLTCARYLREHITSIHFGCPDPTVCDVCGLKFAHGNSLIEHKFRKHDIFPNDGKEYPVVNCPEEGCAFKCLFKETLVRNHSKAHGKTLICDTCGKTVRRAEMPRHLKLHQFEGTKNFICDICGRGFIVPRYLRKHKKDCHGDKKPAYYYKPRNRKMKVK